MLRLAHGEGRGQNCRRGVAAGLVDGVIVVEGVRKTAVCNSGELQRNLLAGAENGGFFLAALLEHHVNDVRGLTAEGCAGDHNADAVHYRLLCKVDFLLGEILKFKSNGSLRHFLGAVKHFRHCSFSFHIFIP